jgi:hypothetical protein
MILMPMVLLVVLGGFLVWLTMSRRRLGHELARERERTERLLGAVSDICQKTVTHYHDEHEAMKNIYDVLAKEGVWYPPPN